jgi:hypothetical protein
MQEVCSQEEPLLERKSGHDFAACHFPLTEDEVRLRLPAALTRAKASTNGQGTTAAIDQPSSSSST